MSNVNSDPDRVELLQGTLDMLILRTLQWGPQHGHGVGQAIRRSSADLLKIERGSLYPALHRLEAQGLISSEWKASELNRRAKYYHPLPGLTDSYPERRRLGQERADNRSAAGRLDAIPCGSSKFTGPRETQNHVTL